VVPFEASQPEPPEAPQGAPEGALPAAAADPALHAGAQGAAPAATGVPPPAPAAPPAVARLVAVDVARARDEDEACRAADGSTVAAFGHPLRCPNSAAGLEHAGGVSAWATHLGEAVLLGGRDRGLPPPGRPGLRSAVARSGRGGPAAPRRAGGPRPAACGRGASRRGDSRAGAPVRRAGARLRCGRDPAHGRLAGRASSAGG